MTENNGKYAHARGAGMISKNAGVKPPARHSPISEAEWQEEVIREVERLGLSYLVIPDMRRVVPKGWPDLVIWGPGGIWFVELKSDDGSVTSAQTSVGLELREAGCTWCVRRPEHRNTLWLELALLAEKNPPELLLRRSPERS